MSPENAQVIALQALGWLVGNNEHAHDLKYDEPLLARYALPGAEAVHWT